MPAKKAPNTDPNNEADENTDGNEPQYVTVEQLNAAIASRLAQFSKQIPKLIETPVQQLGDRLLAQFKETAETAPKDTASPELDKLRRENQATKDALAKMQADQERATAQAKREKARGLLEASLTGVKVHPKLIGAASKLLEDSLGETEDGRIVFRRQNAYGIAEEVSVDDAVKAWAKTEDGKAFISAPAVRGSGAGPRGSGPPVPFRPTPPAQSGNAVQDEAAKLQWAKRELAAAMLGAPTDDD